MLFGAYALYALRIKLRSDYNIFSDSVKLDAVNKRAVALFLIRKEIIKMANFAECTLIKLVPYEQKFIALTTFDIFHGRSTRLLLFRKDFEALVNDEFANPMLDTDIGSYIQITRHNMHLHFKLTILHQDYRNDVTGYIRYFELPIEKINALLNGKSIHHVEYDRDEKAKAQLIITESGHHQLHKYCQDKLTKHALRRFFRDHFNYGRDERLMIYPDNWVKGFYFQCDRLNGGIVRHEEFVTGKDGREYEKVFYAIHT